MNKRFLTPLRSGLLLAVSVCALSLLLFVRPSRLAIKLERSSYDSLFDLSRISLPDVSHADIVLVYMDEDSYHVLDQPFNKAWDRSLHAQLLDRFTAEGARAVVFDIVFSDPGPDPDADRRFADAIRRNGHVILAGDYQTSTSTSGGSVMVQPKILTLPYGPFLTAAAGWGMAQLQTDDDYIVRQHYHSDQRDSYPSLSWAAIQHVQAGEINRLVDPLQERWIRYYGQPETLPSVSYRHTLSPDVLPPNFFHNKIVVIGARPITDTYIAIRDQSRSPFSGLNSDFAFMPNVEVHATELLNLLRQDWLERLPPALELALLVASSVLTSLGFARLRPIHLVPAALAMMVISTGLAYLGFQKSGVWFDWQMVIIVPVVLAAFGAMLLRTVEWYVLRREFRARQQEAQMRIAEQAALLDKAHDAIIVHDFDWKITFWNTGAESTYGWPAGESIGKDIRELLYKLQPEQCKSARDALLVDGEWKGELKHPHQSSRPLTVESRWSLVRDDRGQPKSVLLINTDVTERRELEAQFLRTQRMESIGTLAGGIAHDLNNVLAPIMMGIELINMRNKDEKLASTLSRMAGSAKRGAGLVKQVLTFARGHEGERMSVQASHLIHEMKKIVMETFPRNIEIKSREEAELLPVYADATQLHQVLLNLCVNARDAMPDGGTITIVATNQSIDADSNSRLKKGDYVQLSVSDTGTGIPEEIRERIFEPFFTTKEIGKGTGLGLSTVNTIIKNHDGLLQVLSESGKGTTFNIFIPVAPEGAEKAGDETLIEDIRGDGELILVVDDETAIRELAAAALKEFGYRAVTAANGRDALDLCDRLNEPVSMLVTDIMMPVMDGTKLIRALRNRYAYLPVIAMSGLLESGKTQPPAPAADTVILSKPFEATKLTQAVHRLLRARQPANALA